MTETARTDDRSVGGDASEAAEGLGTLDRAQPIALLASIGLGLGLAAIAPDLTGSLGPLLSAGVFVLIYLVMLGVDLRGVVAAFGQRRFLLAAVTINFVLNPLLAWALGALFLRSTPELLAGFVLFLVTPCIGWYLVFTELAGGDTDLGVGLLAVNIVLQILLLPAYMFLLAGTVTTVSVATIARSVVLFVVGPMVAAAATRRVAGGLGLETHSPIAEAWLPGLKVASLMVVIAAMFASQADVIGNNPGVVVELIVPIGGFFAIGFTVSCVAGRSLQLPYRHTALLAFTTTSRNSEVSLAIAATAFASPLVALAVVVGPIIELPLLVAMVRVLHRIRPWIDRPRLPVALGRPDR